MLKRAVNVGPTILIEGSRLQIKIGKNQKINKLNNFFISHEDNGEEVSHDPRDDNECLVAPPFSKW